MKALQSITILLKSPSFLTLVMMIYLISQFINSVIELTQKQNKFTW